MKSKITWISPKDRAEIVRLYELGMTIRAIMRMTGRSYGGVHHTLTRAQVKMRSVGVEKGKNVDTTVPRIRCNIEE